MFGSGIKLAGVKMTRDDETRHIMLIGDDEDARPTVVRELLRAALGRGDCVVVADPRGHHRSALHDRRRGDVVFDPEYAAPADMAQWIRAGRGALFLEYGVRDLGPVVEKTRQGWLELAMQELMRVRADGRPVWLVVEELDMIAPVRGLAYAIDAFSRCGTRCVVGWGSLSRLIGKLGQTEAYAVLNQCASAVIFKCSGFQPGGTAHFAAGLAGHTGKRYDDGRPVPVLMPEEVDQLPRGTAYLKLASKSDVVRVQVR